MKPSRGSERGTINRQSEAPGKRHTERMISKGLRVSAAEPRTGGQHDFKAWGPR